MLSASIVYIQTREGFKTIDEIPDSSNFSKIIVLSQFNNLQNDIFKNISITNGKLEINITETLRLATEDIKIIVKVNISGVIYDYEVITIPDNTTLSTTATPINVTTTPKSTTLVTTSSVTIPETITNITGSKGYFF